MKTCPKFWPRGRGTAALSDPPLCLQAKQIIIIRPGNGSPTPPTATHVVVVVVVVGVLVVIRFSTTIFPFLNFDRN